MCHSRSVPAWNSHVSVPQVPVLHVLLSADLKGVLYFSTLEEAGGCRQALERAETACVPTPCRVSVVDRALGEWRGGRSSPKVGSVRMVGGQCALVLGLYFLGVCMSLVEVQLIDSGMHRA